MKGSCMPGCAVPVPVLNLCQEPVLNLFQYHFGIASTYRLCYPKTCTELATASPSALGDADLRRHVTHRRWNRSAHDPACTS